YLDLETEKVSVLSGDLKWDVESFALSTDRNTIAYIANEDGRGVLHVMEVGSKKAKPCKLPAGSVTGLHWHNNSTDLGFNLVSARSPMDVYSLDVSTGKVEGWTHSETGGLKTEDFAEPELVRWPSFDKLMISGYLYKPPTRFSGKRPVIIDIHGGPESQLDRKSTR